MARSGTRRTGAGRTRAGLAVVGALLVGLLAGCGGEEQVDASAPVVTGTVVEDGTPVPGVEVRLLGWQAGLTDADTDVGDTSGASGPDADARDAGARPALEEIATAVADDEGRFVLEADVDELTARASTAGLVDTVVEADGDGRSTPATLRLERDPGTGVTDVVAVQDLVVELGEGR